jgi:hypothetical protein
MNPHAGCRKLMMTNLRPPGAALIRRANLALSMPYIYALRGSQRRTRNVDRKAFR